MLSNQNSDNYNAVNIVFTADSLEGSDNGSWVSGRTFVLITGTDPAVSGSNAQVSILNIPNGATIQSINANGVIAATGPHSTASNSMMNTSATVMSAAASGTIDAELLRQVQFTITLSVKGSWDGSELKGYKYTAQLTIPDLGQSVKGTIWRDLHWVDTLTFTDNSILRNADGWLSDTIALAVQPKAGNSDATGKNLIWNDADQPAVPAKANGEVNDLEKIEDFCGMRWFAVIQFDNQPLSVVKECAVRYDSIALRVAPTPLFKQSGTASPIDTSDQVMMGTTPTDPWILPRSDAAVQWANDNSKWKANGGKASQYQPSYGDH